MLIVPISITGSLARESDGGAIGSVCCTGSVVVVVVVDVEVVVVVVVVVEVVVEVVDEVDVLDEVVVVGASVVDVLVGVVGAAAVRTAASTTGSADEPPQAAKVSRPATRPTNSPELHLLLTVPTNIASIMTATHRQMRSIA